MNDENGVFFLPTLPHWEFGNIWSGSRGKMRFFITTSDVEGDEKGKQMLAEIWTEDVCRELAHVLEEKTFPVTQQGLEDMSAWLLERARALQ